MTLCETFRQRAFWTWKQLGRASRADVHLGEESLTDFNLLEIRTNHSQQVKTKTFTKPVEGLVGADWEWWFTGPSNRFIGFRIQAKVIDRRSLRFEELHYKTNGGAFQFDLLCNHAVQAQPPLIPLYCLYTHWSDPMSDLPWRCGSFKGAPESYGCSLVDAFFIRQDHSPSSRDLSHLLPHMMPWHCLVCCRGHSDGDLPERALSLWQAWQESIRSQSGSTLAESRRFELTSEPPTYVLKLLRNELSEPPDPFLRTITVFREGTE